MQERAEEVLGQVYCDLCGPMETPSVEGYHYFITFTNNFSCYNHLGLCKLKDNALGMFKSWLAQAEKETGKSLKVFRSDRGGEFTSGAFKANKKLQMPIHLKKMASLNAQTKP